MKTVHIVDTTLRDGEQAPGVAFSTKEKVQIARMLDSLGVDQIEAGTPAMGSPEIEAVAEIAGLGLQAVVSTWNRMTIGDIKASLSCGVKHIHISAPVSDIQIKYKLGKNRIWVLETMKRALSYAREQDCRVTVGAEDASRADPDFLLSFACHARREGAERLRFADTLGVLDPFRTEQIVKRLVQHTGMDIEFHGHNDFGMATANTFAAYRAGAGYLDTTVGGIGERAGNCSFEEIAAVFKHYGKTEPGLDEEMMAKISRYVAAAANRLKGLGEGGRRLDGKVVYLGSGRSDRGNWFAGKAK